MAGPRSNFEAEILAAMLDRSSQQEGDVGDIPGGRRSEFIPYSATDPALEALIRQRAMIDAVDAADENKMNIPENEPRRRDPLDRARYQGS